MEAAHTDGATLVQGSTKGAGLQGGEVEPLVRYVDVPELGGAFTFTSTFTLGGNRARSMSGTCNLSFRFLAKGGEICTGIAYLLAP